MAEEQQFYRQFLQSTGPDGASTVREIVSPTLLDHDAAAAAEQQAGRTFSGFVAPDKMAKVAPAPAAPSPPPSGAAPATPPLPSAVVPTAGGAPTGYSVAPPGSSPWLSAIPPLMAAAGPTALAVAQPELGIPLWLASAGLAALGGGGGEALREHLAGEELSPRDIATQGAVSGLTEGTMQAAIPLATPIVKAVGGRIFPTLGAVEELGPVLAAKNAATAAAPTVADLAGEGAKVVRSASEPAFDAARVAGSGLPVSTAGLDPHVTAASNALVRAGATPAQIQEFGTVVSPMKGGAPGDYAQLMGRERQLENWISGMRAQGADPADVAAVERLHTAVGGQIDAAAAGTGAAPMRAQYVNVQGEQLPTRYALSSLEGNPNLAAQTPATIQAIAKQASDADRPVLAAAWVDSARQAAAQSGNPVLYMRAAYEGLGPETQAALFGAQKGGFERVLQTAWGGTGHEVLDMLKSTAIGGGGLGAGHLGIPFHVPGLATARGALDLATPFAARGALVNPRMAAFGANLSRATGVAAPATARLVGQAYGEQARQAGLPF